MLRAPSAVVEDEPPDHEEQRHELHVVRHPFVEEVDEVVHLAVGETPAFPREDLDHVGDVHPGAVDHQRDREFAHEVAALVAALFGR